MAFLKQIPSRIEQNWNVFRANPVGRIKDTKELKVAVGTLIAYVALLSIYGAMTKMPDFRAKIKPYALPIARTVDGLAAAVFIGSIGYYFLKKPPMYAAGLKAQFEEAVKDVGSRWERFKVWLKN